MAGYSKKTLAQKLGILSSGRSAGGRKEVSKIVIVNAPKGYREILGELPGGIKIHKDLEQDSPFIHFFTKEKEELKKWFPKLKTSLSFNGFLWISWPKRAAKIPTDLNENVVRDIGLQNGLVDVKVIAVDNVWSGLKFVYRVKDKH